MWKKSFISNKYPSYRDVPLNDVHSWLQGKRKDDNAEGLWRIHDTLYDFSNFIDKHPGGQFWLQVTKGTDITEAFEAHHISLGPKELLAKYEVRKAASSRNMTLTFKENGFYNTLKSRVCEKLKNIDYSPMKRTDMIHTTLFALTYVFAVLSIHFQSKLIAMMSGTALTWTIISAHNYFHRKDNWRMYTFNLSMMNFKDWRISHALSHHLFPNSFHDLELSMFEPFFCWIPNPYIKNWFQRYASWIYGPIVYMMLYLSGYLKKIVLSLVTKKQLMELDDLIPLSVPFVMFLATGDSLLTVFKLYFIIILFGSFLFSLIGLNAAHHHPDVVHDGDALREDRDWGLYQLDAVMDRADLKGSQFWVLTHFGDHGLHHLFPTLDHSILPQLYPLLYQTLEEFQGQIRECSFLHHIIGQHKQLARIKPRETPPGPH